MPVGTMLMIVAGSMVTTTFAAGVDVVVKDQDFSVSSALLLESVTLVEMFTE